MKSTAKKKEEAKKLIAFPAKLTPEAKRLLEAHSFATHESAYAIIEKAFWVYWEGLPQEQRAKIQTIADAKDDLSKE